MCLAEQPFFVAVTSYRQGPCCSQIGNRLLFTRGYIYPQAPTGRHESRQPGGDGRGIEVFVLHYIYSNVRKMRQYHNSTKRLLKRKIKTLRTGNKDLEENLEKAVYIARAKVPMVRLVEVAT